MFAPSAALGLYIHIPYCLQRCTYCDFATYSQDQVRELRLPSHETYFALLKKELALKVPSLRGRTLASIYFGGGTPSLVSADLIVDLLSAIEKEGLQRSPACEVTLEINPATIDHRKMESYLRAGVNRFSVGAQSFNDTLLKSVNREHNAEQTRETLTLLNSYGVNFSFDILFALPGQTRSDLQLDLDEVAFFKPHHVSPYCLTVPEGHPLARQRLTEDLQLEMFALISDNLEKNGYHRYEISNFCRPGYESRHNTLYWNDSEYLGLGLSAHSYLHDSQWGVRFWNPNAIGAYQELISSQSEGGATSPYSFLPGENREDLLVHQALTDFCHTSLRMTSGLSLPVLTQKFGDLIARKVQAQLAELETRGWLERTSQPGYSLSEQGLLVSNQVYSALTYLPGEV